MIPKKSKISASRDFKISRMKPKIKATNPHKHDEYHELIYLSEGSGFHTIDLQTYQISTPCLFLVKAGEVHYWEFTEIPRGYVVIFKADFLVHLASQNIYSSFNQTRNRYFPIHQNEDFPFLSLLDLMNAEYSNMYEASNRVIASSLELILIQMNRISERISKPRANIREKTFKEFQQLLETELTKFHQVKEYAEKLNITAKHLNKIAKQVTGKTASEVISEALILEAQRQLIYSSKNVSEIGYTLGFNNPSHFIKFFKSKVKLTPDRYRQHKITNMPSST